MEGALENLIELSAEGARRQCRRISQAKGQSDHIGSLFDRLLFFRGCRLKKTGSLFIILFSLQYFNQE